MKDKLIASERMKDFYNDVKHWTDYDFVVINDDLNKCYKEIFNIINYTSSKKEKIKYNKKFIENHIKNLTS